MGAAARLMHMSRAASHTQESKLAREVAAMPDDTRKLMQVIVRGSLDADSALEPVIELLSPGDARRVAAIVQAFRTHEALRAQWLRTYELLQTDTPD